MLNKTLDYILAHKLAFIALGTAIFLAVVVIVSNIIYLAGQDQAAGNRPMVTISAKPEKVISIPAQSPPSVDTIAQRFHATRIHDDGKGLQGLILDSGSFYINGSKYGVDVFRGKASRNLWLKMAEPYGVQPRWETSTYVIYPSVD